MVNQHSQPDRQWSQRSDSTWVYGSRKYDENQSEREHYFYD